MCVYDRQRRRLCERRFDYFIDINLIMISLNQPVGPWEIFFVKVAIFFFFFSTQENFHSRMTPTLMLDVYEAVCFFLVSDSYQKKKEIKITAKKLKLLAFEKFIGN